jgi:hypothetical protein
MNAMNVASDGGFFSLRVTLFMNSELLARYNLAKKQERHQQWNECGRNAPFAGMSQTKGISF